MRKQKVYFKPKFSFDSVEFETISLSYLYLKFAAQNTVSNNPLNVIEIEENILLGLMCWYRQGHIYMTFSICYLSFRINNDWTFDDAVSQKYGCEVHAFDPR